MENAAKALMIAGGVLISIIIISMFILMINDLTSFQQNENDMKRQEQLLEFNQQFEIYNSDSVRGNDLMSLINKTIDYNKRNTTAVGADQGNDGYEPITIEIDLNGKQSELAIDPDNVLLFKSTKYELNNNNTNPLTTIIGDINSLKNKILKENGKEVNYSETILNNLVTAYNKIFIDNFESKTNIEKSQVFFNINRVFGIEVYKLYNSDDTLISDKDLNDLWKENFIKDLKDDVNKFFEYVQFKRAVFKCEGKNGAGGIEYSQNNGRVTKMSFKFTGEFN